MKSSNDKLVQQISEDTNLPPWQVVNAMSRTRKRDSLVRRRSGVRIVSMGDLMTSLGKRSVRQGYSEEQKQAYLAAIRDIAFDLPAATLEHDPATGELVPADARRSNDLPIIDDDGNVRIRDLHSDPIQDEIP